ncbi:VOC family protein, partial [Ideonella sp.]|uniref:VOC family protein n=1 Tax=Ideonella sp. TaxID=1929293 RepID=UPI003BB74492
MSSAPGNFIWYELMTTDAPAAEAFYEAVVGWQMQDAGMPDMRYTLLHAGPAMVAGLMAWPADMLAAGARPAWTGYVHVDDVDAVAAKVLAAGGSVHRAPEDIPGVGRFAVVADAQGASFDLFKPLPGDTGLPAASDAPGTVGWHELHAEAGETALDFYSDLFGWTEVGSLDMGIDGTYQMFATAAGQTAMGGIMTRSSHTPRPFWLYYF